MWMSHRWFSVIKTIKHVCTKQIVNDIKNDFRIETPIIKLNKNNFKRFV